MSTQFSIGDHVYVSNPQLKMYREEGTVQRYKEDASGNVTYDVGFTERGKIVSIAEHNLSLHPNQSGEPPMTDKHLAYVYYHDGDANPTSLEDAMSYHLEEANRVIYGTKDEILEEIKDGGQQYNSYDHGFVIIDGKLHNIQTTVSVDW